MMENKKDSSHRPTHHHQSKKNKTMDGAIESLRSGETPKFIPQGIIEEILVRLPAKSLLRFRCVSKSWLSLISSPKFIKTHVTYSALDPALSNYRVMLSVSYDPIHDELKHDSVSFVVGDLFTDVVVKNVDCPKERSKWGFYVNCSCNGLLCVSVCQDDGGMFFPRKNTFLWNPCLRKSKRMPFVTAQEKISMCKYGMGYDETNDDYKIVGLFWYFCKVADVLKLMVQIYSLKNDSWKRIDDFKGGLLSTSPSVISANGKFHFLDTFNNDNPSIRRSIASLDLANEAYGTIAQPKYDDNYCRTSLVILRGCIGAVYGYERDRVDVWVLKEYDVAESWTKLVSIPYVDGSPCDYTLPYRMCIFRNGKYFLDCGTHRAVYDPKDNSFLYPRKGSIAEMRSTVIYAESLVALPNLSL